jgi:hypothetical protein
MDLLFDRKDLRHYVVYLQSGIEQKMKQATDWLQDPAALIGSLGRSNVKLL